MKSVRLEFCALIIDNGPNKSFFSLKEQESKQIE